MRALVYATLTNAGHRVLQASDGVEALEVAKTENVSLVLADVNMPNMDGITMVRELRMMSHYRFTPIPMLTTESGTDRKKEAKAAGATWWLV